MKKNKQPKPKDAKPDAEIKLDVEKIRKDFPILSRKINGNQLIYFDNAATSQKPMQVIKAMDDFYMQSNANVHRSVHKLGEESTEAYELAHKKTAEFIHADFSEVIFTKNATEAINLAMYSWGMQNIRKGDEIVLTQMEHHSNLVPWQYLAKTKRASLKFLELDAKKGRIMPEDIYKKITNKTKLVSVTHMSNVLGTINPVREIIDLAHDKKALVMLDVAQSVPHMPVDAQKLDADFMAFSGHKMLGPTGTGVLFAKKGLLEKMQPFNYGGDMISSVSYEDAEWNELPWKFEAGSPNVAGAVGLSAAIDYLRKVGMDKIVKHDASLTKYALERLAEIKQVTIFGPQETNDRGPVISFTLGDIHAHDVSTILDRDGIEVRGGHHCAMPLARLLGVTATTRASFYLYNTKDEIDKFIASLAHAARIFRL